MLTIVDDYTRYDWIFILRSKTEVTKAIQVFLNMAFTQFDSLVQIERTGNRTKFIDKE